MLDYAIDHSYHRMTCQPPILTSSIYILYPKRAQTQKRCQQLKTSPCVPNVTRRTFSNAPIPICVQEGMTSTFPENDVRGRGYDEPLPRTSLNFQMALNPNTYVPSLAERDVTCLGV